MRFVLTALVAAVAPAAGARISGFREQEGQRAGGALRTAVGGLQDDEAGPAPPLKGQQVAKVRSGLGGCIEAGGICSKGSARQRCCEGLVGTGGLGGHRCGASYEDEVCEDPNGVTEDPNEVSEDPNEVSDGNWVMTDHGQGYCTDGYYAGWDGLGTASQKDCNLVCLSETQCTFAAWFSGKTCSRYNKADCSLNGRSDHYTYKKGAEPETEPEQAPPGYRMFDFGYGHCEYGYYAGWDGLGTASQEACNAVCLGEARCTFAAWKPGETCSRYDAENCIVFTGYDHHTYEKKWCETPDAPNWHDSDGPDFDCDWYALYDRWRCVHYGHKRINFGMTANQACCVCAEWINEDDPGFRPDDYYYYFPPDHEVEEAATESERLRDKAFVPEALKKKRAERAAVFARASQMAEPRNENEDLAAESAVIVPELRENGDLADEKPALVVPDAPQDASAGGSERPPDADGDAARAVRKNEDLAAEIRPHAETSALEDVAAL